MTLREQILTAAVTGGSPSLEAGGSPLSGLLAQISRRDSPQRLLDAIALVTVYEDAGAGCLPAPAFPDPCPPDPRPVCGAAAAGHLAEIVGEHAGLLAEWLTLLNESGLQPPPEMLPALLDAAWRTRNLRKAAAQAAGVRGAWLAQYRQGWNWARGAGVDEAAWETGSLVERLAILQEVRAVDAARGRALIESVWSVENADARRQLLETLATGLSPSDEPFLENCLDDRSTVVRRAACGLLGSLPESALTKRMSARLEGRIRIVRTGLLGTGRGVELTPLEAFDESMARDGIDRKPPGGSPLGERGFWTAQTLACVPPSKWITESGPEVLLEAAKDSEWSEVLLEGWRKAAIRYRDAAWLMAFTWGIPAMAEQVVDTFHALEPRDRERALRRLIEADAKLWLPRVPALCPHAWSPGFTQSFLKSVNANLPTAVNDTFGHYIDSALKAAALLACPTCQSIPQDPAFIGFASTLNYRRNMQHALRQNQENRSSVPE